MLAVLIILFMVKVVLITCRKKRLELLSVQKRMCTSLNYTYLNYIYRIIEINLYKNQVLKRFKEDWRALLCILKLKEWEECECHYNGMKLRVKKIICRNTLCW